MNIYDFNNYVKYMEKKLFEMPKRGHGQLSVWAKVAGVHTTFMSQVLKEKKTLTLEQALLLCEYWGLNDGETEYFFTLVLKEKSGSYKLKDFFKNKISKSKNESKEIKNKVVKAKTLNEIEKSVFYSHWLYSAVRLLTSISEFQTPQKISEKLNIPLAKTIKILQFLVEIGLCSSSEGIYSMTTQSTHVDRNSLYVLRHHENWRLQALKNLDLENQENLFFTAPLTISNEDFDTVKNKILELIKEISEKVNLSKSEELVCLNIDLFKIENS